MADEGAQGVQVARQDMPLAVAHAVQQAPPPMGPPADVASGRVDSEQQPALVLEPPQKVVRSAIFYQRALDDGGVPRGSSESMCALPCCKLSVAYSDVGDARNRFHDQITQNMLDEDELEAAQFARQKRVYNTQLKDMKESDAKQMTTWADVELVGESKYMVNAASVGAQLLIRADYGWYQDLTQDHLDALRLTGIPASAMPTHFKGRYQRHSLNWMHLTKKDNRRKIQRTILCLTAGQIVASRVDPCTGEAYVSAPALGSGPVNHSDKELIAAFETLPFYAFDGNGKRKITYPLKNKFSETSEKFRTFYQQACCESKNYSSVKQLHKGSEKLWQLASTYRPE